MTDLIKLSAADLAAKLASREVSSVEATQAHLDRISAVDGDVHAYLHVNAAAIAEATAIDERRAAGSSSTSSPVFPLPSRTCSARSACRRPLVPRFSRAGFRPTTRLPLRS